MKPKHEFWTWRIKVVIAWRQNVYLICFKKISTIVQLPGHILKIGSNFVWISELTVTFTESNLSEI